MSKIQLIYKDLDGFNQSIIDDYNPSLHNFEHYANIYYLIGYYCAKNSIDHNSLLSITFIIK